jgi:hypothetical protein
MTHVTPMLMIQQLPEGQETYNTVLYRTECRPRCLRVSSEVCLKVGVSERCPRENEVAKRGTARVERENTGREGGAVLNTRGFRGDQTGF